MKLDIKGKNIEVNAQGFLLNLEDGCEEYAVELAARDDAELFVNAGDDDAKAGSWVPANSLSLKCNAVHC